VLDGELYSAPQIKEHDRGRAGVISGLSTSRKPSNLREHPGESARSARVRIIEERAVDPSLARIPFVAAIKASVNRHDRGGAFMAVYYLLGGMVAKRRTVLNLLVVLLG
jgi:preprotein translocase subunit SecD